MLRTHALAGRTVLIVHEDAFQAAYLAEVLRGSGAEIGGVTHGAPDGLRFLAASDRPVAVVFSRTVAGDDPDGWSDAGVLLMVHPAGGTAAMSGVGRCALVAPYAGFQVVDALAALFTNADVAPDAVRPAL